ncbi:helix-turn-helix domain-containing protein [Enterococcus gilvus]|uniref:helix-turn-helix domain-containing protein n=1 Tax=Enterococcus gilvus TaxID=160453 RepID=UPI0028D02EEE|nr:helix-turn-helix domain-containing protein [Enterococcus gilvus]
MTNLALVNLDDLKILLAENELKNEVWETEQAAEFLKISVSHLKAQARAGVVPGQKLGDGWRFSSIALYKLVAKE